MFELIGVKVGNILEIEKLTIPEGKFTCILGPSGSGKSTLLRLLNNLDDPDEGRILYNRQSIADIEPLVLRRKIVMVPQAPLIFEGTVEDNLQLGLSFSERAKASEKEMEAVLQMFLLDKKLGDDAEYLSGGEKQRLSWARAVLMKPEVMLLDEPTSALDEETAKTVIKRFHEHAKDKAIDVIMITHSKEIADMVAENKIEMTNYSIESRES